MGGRNHSTPDKISQGVFLKWHQRLIFSNPIPPHNLIWLSSLVGRYWQMIALILDAGVVPFRVRLCQLMKFLYIGKMLFQHLRV